MGTLKVNGNIEASTMLKLNGDWETDFGILFQEGGDSSYGAFIKYGLNDYLTIGTRNNNNDVTAIKIYRGDNSITINGSVTASSFIGNLNGNATSASSVPWSGITGKPSSFTPASHTHNTLTAGGEGGTASVRTADYTSTVLTGGWASSEVGYGWTYGTTLDISGFSTWYHRLAFRTDGNIEYWHGINTKTMTKVGNLCFTGHSHSSYLPLSGGTMSGSPVIKFPASQGSIATSDPMAITYGRISAYGTLCINADSDGSTNEYLILTSGRGLSSSAADGLAIGYNTLTWQNNTVIHTGNIGSQSVNYATSAGNADRVYPINSNPNNSHPGYGLKVFYSWDQGQVGNDNGGYANGITIGSHPSDQAYGFQIVQNMWNDRTYTRRYNYGWQSWKTLAWTDDLAAYLPLSGGTMTGHLYATSGLSWNNSYWTPNGNITCTPTGNGQEWSFDVGASGYTGCYWHVWSSKNGCSMLRCDADTNAVGIPNGPLYLGSSCYGPNLPGASYVGQIFFKT